MRGIAAGFMLFFIIGTIKALLPIEKRLYKGLTPKHNEEKDCLNDTKASLILGLIKYISEYEMSKCSMTVLYHQGFKFKGKASEFNLWDLLHHLQVPYIHAEMRSEQQVLKNILKPIGKSCIGYLIFIRDIRLLGNVIGNQPSNKVIAITSSSRWEIEEYVASKNAKNIYNLLIVSTTGARDVLIRQGELSSSMRYLNLYTHKLFAEATGSSTSQLLTSWRCGQLSRNESLFPSKISNGFNGRRFIILASEKPPFVVKTKIKISDNDDNTQLWDGVEVRLLKLLSKYLNFTIDIKESVPTNYIKGPEESVVEGIYEKSAEIGIAGVYVTNKRLKLVDFSLAHTVDCATFTTRSSSALPRYRAILGPFQWQVWLALLFVYLIAIFPMIFAEKHSFDHMIKNPWHIETMFWYVFGTFTNLFTFKGSNSWTKSEKIASRILVGKVFFWPPTKLRVGSCFIGWYWVFSVIINACYTGSIIAFITLFVYPPVIDTTDQLHKQNYRIGSLSTGDWGSWFNNSDHPKTKWLLRDIELVQNVTTGLKNVSDSFFLPLLRPYAFLAGRQQLEYVIRTNFTLKKRKKDILYTSKDCFVPFNVAIVFPKGSGYIEKLNKLIQRAQQGGLFDKLLRDIYWDFQRGEQGQLMQAGSGALREAVKLDRILTLDDTQGMFLLLGAGYLIAIFILFMESSKSTQARGKIQLEHLKQIKQKLIKCWQCTQACWLINQDQLSIHDGGDEEDLMRIRRRTVDSRLINSSFAGNHKLPNVHTRAKACIRRADKTGNDSGNNIR